MKAHELVKLNGLAMKMMSMNGINLNDYRFVQLFEDYSNMKKNGDKITYIVSVLSKKNNIGERTIYRIVDRFERDCKI